MPRCSTRPVPLTGLVLPDARTGAPVDLGALRGPAVLVAVRHRY
jgi:hypothetical protein